MPPRPANNGDALAGDDQQDPTGCNSATKRQAPPERRQATAIDALRHGIPHDYILDHWDPDEKPILLLGTVFDANSLGKWIYDWAIIANGSQNPINDVAGDLWLQMIRFYGEIKTSEWFVRGNKRATDAKSLQALHLVRCLLHDTKPLIKELKRLLRQCEKFMLKAKRKGKLCLGKRSAYAFVDTLFGRDDLLEDTQNFVQGMRNWNFKFDEISANVMKPRREAE